MPVMTADPVQDCKPPGVGNIETAAGLTLYRWRADPSALASNPQTVGADPAGLVWSAICCTVWRGSITGAHPCTLIYLIIIGRLR